MVGLLGKTPVASENNTSYHVLFRLDELMATIDTLMTSQDPVEDVGVEVKVGDYCLAEYSSYDKRYWYKIHSTCTL